MDLDMRRPREQEEKTREVVVPMEGKIVQCQGVLNTSKEE